MNKVERVHLWDEFKRLATTLHPSSIAYTFEKSPFSKPPLALRLSFGTEGIQYVFLDFAQGEALKRTKIPVHLNKMGEPYPKGRRSQKLHSHPVEPSRSIYRFIWSPRLLAVQPDDAEKDNSSARDKGKCASAYKGIPAHQVKNLT